MAYNIVNERDTESYSGWEIISPLIDRSHRLGWSVRRVQALVDNSEVSELRNPMFGLPSQSAGLTPSNFHFLNQNVLAGGILFFWNQYSNIVRTKLSSTAYSKSYNKKVKFYES